MNFVMLGSSAVAVHAPEPDKDETVMPVSQARAEGAEGTRAPKPDRRSPDRPMPGRDRRWSQRDTLHREGVMSADTLAEPMTCRLIDISRYGAMIEIAGDEHEMLPDTFKLVFSANPRIRSEANCILRWYRNGRAGVSFAGPVRTTVVTERT